MLAGLLLTPEFKKETKITSPLMFILRFAKTGQMLYNLLGNAGVRT
jgi:hypothetical protein